VLGKNNLTRYRCKGVVRTIRAIKRRALFSVYQEGWYAG